MRAGGCTVQQSLTADAVAVVKQAVSLARRRGNAQVTPLHVASAMLAAPGGLLRSACLRSHSHYPLQCKALELCFNVALNRLPASASSSPLLGGQYYPPSLSNALVAAFKRAQAHQRRGSSVESPQQQPAVLAVKIELEQLVVSVLDDPSVSRVMREAGFSSTQVKANVEQALCGSTATTTTTPKPSPNISTTNTATASPPQETKATRRPLDHVRDEDVTAVLDCLAAQRKRRVVVVAESATAAEALACAAVDKIKRAEVKEYYNALRGVQVVNLRVSSFRDMGREDTERRLGELRRLVSGSSRGQQVLLLVEDLKWAAEFWAGRLQSGRRGCYCPVEHVVTEVRALAGSSGLCWLVGFGTYQAYMKCRAGQPSLESLWGLQTLTVPAGSLALSLTCAFDNDDSALDTVINQSMKASPYTDGNGPASWWPLSGGNQLLSRCCGDRSAARIDTKAELPLPFVSTSTSLPSWLQHCRDQEATHLTDLGKTAAWSSICSKPSQRMTTLHFSAPGSPASSVSSYEHGHRPHQPSRHPWLLADLDPKHPWKPKRETSRRSCGSTASGGPSIGPVEVERRAKFKELSAENLKVLCGALERAVPWQREIVPEIASAVLQCRSGIAKRRDRSRSTGAKEETWMFFLGGDIQAKEMVARELARLVYGSRNNVQSIRLDAAAASPSSSGGSSDEERRSKRPRTSSAAGGKLASCLERLYEAAYENPHRVVLLEVDVDQADRDCELRIKDAIESGVVRNHAGEEVGLGDAIIILSCDSFEKASRSRACSPPPSEQMKQETEEEQTRDHKHDEIGSATTSSCFDLNIIVESDDQVDEPKVDDLSLLAAVDRTLFFKRHEQEHS